MRLPNWAYARLERVYLDQRRARREESAAQAERDDRALRAWADRKREVHRAGTCGGSADGCPYHIPTTFSGWRGLNIELEGP